VLRIGVGGGNGPRALAELKNAICIAFSILTLLKGISSEDGIRVVKLLRTNCAIENRR
jgi:hypothetical protein